MIQRFFLVPVVLILILVGIGCPKDELGGGLVVSPTSIDFGKEKISATLEVWKTTTSSSIGPIFAEATVPWIVINNCTSPSDNCVSSGPLDRIKIEVKVDREKTLLGNNSGTIIVRATNAPTVEVPITLTDLIFVDFDATNKFSTVKDPVRFVNQSSVFGADIEIKRYIWDFGDGDTSNDKNPVHYYSQPGKYTVSLTVETTHGTEKRVKEGFINVSPKELIVDFTVTPQVAFVGEEVQFVDNSVSSAEPIVKRVWDFGDGNKSEEVNPKHVYITPGVYNVTLTVVTSFQEKSLTKPGAVTIQSGAPPTAKFSVSQVKPFVNIPVQFYDLSQLGSAPITEWIWDFGDGNIVRYTDSDPTHEPQYAFSRIGVQNVRLTVTNRFGSSSFSLPVDVVYMPPVANFSVDTTEIYEGESVLFVDFSRGGTERIVRWVWDFGDGTTETIEYQPYYHENGNTTHVFATKGSYDVKLTVYTSTSSNNESSITKSNLITVHKAPIPSLALSTRSPLVNKNTTFLNRTILGTESGLTYEWDFGDGSPSKVTSNLDPVVHVYTEPGVYDVVLRVKTPLKIFTSDTLKVYVDAPPVPDFDYDPKKATIESIIQFTDTSQTVGTRPITGWVWSFGDGTPLSNLQNPTHRYSSPGRYKVELYLKFVHSRSREELVTDPVFRVLTIGNAIPPTARFRVISPCAIVGSEVKFVDLSVRGSSEIGEWEWDFGDGSMSNEQSPSHIYQSPGSYTVRLKVRSVGGLESEYVNPDCVNVRDYTSPLDVFVNEIDQEYSWTTPTVYPVSFSSGFFPIRIATAYVTRMTSQIWRRADEIYTGRIWQHNLTIVVPETLKYNTALLFIDGGSVNSSPPNDSERLFLGQLAALSGCTVVHLDNVPSQPIVFIDDYDPYTNEVLFSRSEDAIISYSYDKFMNEYKNGNYDYKWPVLLAMAKSAVRAMDTTQAILGDRAPEYFIISGGSKRGWTTWLAGLTDCRIKAIAPLVIDVLNMDKQMEHHKKVYGYWAPSIYEYAQMKVFDRLVNEEGLPEEALELLKIVDPYEYLGRMDSIPKFIMNSACDEFFVPDSSRWYYEDLPGEKLLNYVPNVPHSLGDYFDVNSQSVQNLLAWFLVKTQELSLPRYRWIRESQETLRVEVDSAFINSIQEVKLWKCTNPYARDFRKYKLDSWNLSYEATTLLPISPGVYRVTVAMPSEGWTAYFIQLKFNNPAKFSMAIPGVSVPPLVFTTPIFVIPDQYPTYVSERGSVGPYPLLVLRGSSYEMGYSYGTLMKSEIQNHVNYVYTNLTSRFGILSDTLNSIWDIQKNMIDERIREEIQGIADATGISYENLGKLQLVELLSTYSTNNNTNVRASGSVIWSSAINFGSYWGISPVVVTYSFNRKLYSNGQQNYPAVLFYIPDQGFPHALITFAGLVVGRVGVNIAGISYGDIPVLNEVPVTTENMLFTLRESLYDSNRLKDTIDLVRLESKGRWHKYLLADGRYEKRGAKIRVDNNNTVLSVIRDNSPFDEYNPRIKRYVVYAGHDSVTANSIYDYILGNYGTIDLNKAFALVDKGSILGYNLIDVLIDATSFTAYVAYAQGISDAILSNDKVVDFQSLLP